MLHMDVCKSIQSFVYTNILPLKANSHNIYTSNPQQNVLY